MKMRQWGVLLAAMMAPGTLAAQGECYPSSTSNEAKTFAILSVPVAFTGARSPAPNPKGWALGIEVASLPGVDRETATPTTCRPGKGPENTDPIPVLIRPRLAVAVGGFLLEAGWTPPIRLNGVKSNLVSLAVARPFALTSDLTLGVRAHAVLGSLTAPVTCDDDALLDITSECFGGTRSDDRWQPGVHGVEAVLGVRGRVRPHLGIGYTRLRPRFTVNFTNAVGDTDRRFMAVDLDRVALFAGVSTAVGPLRATAEGYATVGDAITARLVVRYQ